MTVSRTLAAFLAAAHAAGEFTALPNISDYGIRRVGSNSFKIGNSETSRENKAVVHYATDTIR